MNRPFGTLQPNLSASERIKNVKARSLYKTTKRAFSRNAKQHKNSEIKVSPAGIVYNTRSNELRYLINRGYALCEDGECPCWFEGSNVTPQTENNLFTHYVSGFLPRTPAYPFPMLATKGVSGENPNYLTYGHIDVSGVDPSGAEDQYSGAPWTENNNSQYSIFTDPLGLYSPYNNTCRPGYSSGKTIFKHNWNQTMVRGNHDIINDPDVAQGGNGFNLSWSNNTKQNYLIAYDPRNTKVRLNICPAEVICDNSCCCMDISINWYNYNVSTNFSAYADRGDTLSDGVSLMATVIDCSSGCDGTYSESQVLRIKLAHCSTRTEIINKPLYINNQIPGLPPDPVPGTPPGSGPYPGINQVYGVVDAIGVTNFHGCDCKMGWPRCEQGGVIMYPGCNNEC